MRTSVVKGKVTHTISHSYKFVSMSLNSNLYSVFFLTFSFVIPLFFSSDLDFRRLERACEQEGDLSFKADLETIRTGVDHISW